jgi:hypothetical protein
MIVVERKFLKRIDSGSDPVVDFLLDQGVPQQIWSWRKFWDIIDWRRLVHIVASTTMFCTVATCKISRRIKTKMPMGSLPLRISFVTSDVSSFASFAAFSRFGMALARGSTTRSCHYYNGVRGEGRPNGGFLER